MAFDFRTELLQARSNIDKLLKQVDAIKAMEKLADQFQKQDLKNLRESREVGARGVKAGEVKTPPLTIAEEDFMFDIDDFFGDLPEFDGLPRMLKSVERLSKRYAKFQARKR